MIVDAGTRTTDVLTCDGVDMSPVEGLSFSLETGVAAAAGKVAARAQSETGHLPPPDVAGRVLLGEAVVWHGRRAGGAAEALDAVASEVRAEVGRRFGKDVGRVLATAVVGGGGVLLRDRLAGLLPGETVAATPEEMLFANALGFQWVAEQSALRAVV